MKLRFNLFEFYRKKPRLIIVKYDAGKTQVLYNDFPFNFRILPLLGLNEVNES